MVYVIWKIECRDTKRKNNQDKERNRRDRNRRERKQTSLYEGAKLPTNEQLAMEIVFAGKSTRQLNIDLDRGSDKGAAT